MLHHTFVSSYCETSVILRHLLCFVPFIQTRRNAVLWADKRYHSLDYEMKARYGHKIYKIALDGGFTCPNRDGHIDTRGCIFCSAGGSGDFAASRQLSITEQIEEGKQLLAGKRLSGKLKVGSKESPMPCYIAYFQAFTGTYDHIERLRSLYTEAIRRPEVAILSIATRPDCLSPEVLDLLSELNQIKPVWIELGLQTIHPQTARYIRRGYPLEVFDDAVVRLKAAGIQVITHVILFLPGETEAQMLKTIDYLNCNPIDGIKLQLLHILKGTDLARDYARSPFHIPDMDEYIRCIGNCIAHLRPDIVIHRLTGDGPKDLLIEPQWTGAKRTVLNHIHQYLKKQDIWQGKEYYG